MAIALGAMIVVLFVMGATMAMVAARPPRGARIVRVAPGRYVAIAPGVSDTDAAAVVRAAVVGMPRARGTYRTRWDA